MRATSPDTVIHQPTRLKIVAVLEELPVGDSREFKELKSILKTTDGNLGSHLNTLEKAGYIEPIKDFVGKKPRTRIRLTASGRSAFEKHLGFLRSVVGDKI